MEFLIAECRVESLMKDGNEILTITVASIKTAKITK